MRFGDIALSSLVSKRISDHKPACEWLGASLRLSSFWSAESSKALASLANEISFDANETIFEDRQPNKNLYIVSSGVVRKFKLTTDGRRQIIGFSLPGDWIGTSLRNEFTFFADAVDAVNCHFLPRTSVIALIDKEPDVLEGLQYLSDAQLAVAEDHLLLLGRHSAEEKIASFLLMMRERWARLGKSSIMVHLPMNRRDIADYLGLTIETVSRTLGRFAREGLILPIPDGVRLLDVESLEQLLGLGKLDSMAG